MITTDELVKLAYKAREKSYSPYSHFAVGAALLCKSGKVYLGCNIENASFPMTNCAERTAFFKAVSEGEKEFEAIAICGGPTDGREYDDYCSPCGACRQVMAEFCSPNDFKVIICRNEHDYKTFLLKEILPLSFGPNDLK